MAKSDPTELDFYEGLVRKTASMYERLVDEDFDDLCQIFRIKAWRALGTYDPTRSSMSVERYVFSCIRNQVKDVLKKERNVLRRDGRGDLFIEDVAPTTPGEGHGGQQPRDKWEHRYMEVGEDEAFAELKLDVPLIPSTLDGTELQVVALLYADFGHAEIALRIGITKREVSLAVKSIREKMADWRPSNGRQAISEKQEEVPVPPLRVAA